jgi:hypothetical protein
MPKRLADTLIRTVRDGNHRVFKFRLKAVALTLLLRQGPAWARVESGLEVNVQRLFKRC